MTENANANTPSPEGAGDEPQTPEIRQTDGTRRPMSPTEARVLRERQGGVRMNESDAQALDKIREQDDAARAKEDAARQKGEKSWEDLEERTSDDPAQAGGLELEIPAEVPQQFYEETQANVQQAGVIAAELGVPRAEAQGLVDYAVALAVSDQSGLNLENEDACRGVLTSRYGKDEAAKIVADCQRMVQKLGPKAEEFLDGGLGNSPAVIAALAAMWRGDFRMSPEKAQAALDEMKKDPRGALRNANHSAHKAAVDRANLLYQITARADAKKESQPATKKSALPSPTNAKKASLERELQSAINDPDYRKSGPKHAAAVARVEALYRDLFPGHRNENGEDE